MRRKALLFALIRLTLPTLLVIVAVLVLMSWRVATRIQADLTVDRAVLTVGGVEGTPILNAVAFQSVTVERFARVAFSPARLELADPAQYVATENRYPESAWRALTVLPPVVITGEDDTLQPAVTLESATPGPNASGILDGVWAGPGAEVTMEVRRARMTHLSIKVDHQKSSAAVSFHEPFRLLAQYNRITGVGSLPHKTNSVTYRAQLADHSPLIELVGQPSSLVLILTIASGKPMEPLFKGRIPVTALDFSHQNPRGEPETSLTRDGEIGFPDYPNLPKVSFRAADSLSLDRLGEFHVEEIGLDQERQALRLRLNGIASRIRTGSQAFPKDLRLTRFETLSHNSRLVLLLSVVAWVFPTTIGGYRLYREVKGKRV